MTSNDDYRSWFDDLTVIRYEAAGFGSFGLIVAVMRAQDDASRRQVLDWQNMWLIRNQGILFACGYDAEARREAYKHIEALRASGKYAEMFRKASGGCHAHGRVGRGLKAVTGSPMGIGETQSVVVLAAS